MLRRVFFNEKLVLVVIILNAIVITWESFPSWRETEFLHDADYFFVIFFLVEMLVKLQCLGRKTYFKDPWNIFDSFLVIVSLPSLLGIFFDVPNTSVLLGLRMFRLLRLFRFFRFIPHLHSIVRGISRAMRASVFVILLLLFLNFIFALITCHLFGKIDPAFEDPLISAYTIFQLFTIEGWNEIPSNLAENMKEQGTMGGNLNLFIWLMRIYFALLVTIGGLFGMSLVNAIFVDEMMMDNNEELEEKIDLLHSEIKELKEMLKSKE